MIVEIFGSLSLAIAIAATSGIVYLLWKIRHEQAMEELRAFADMLPEDERIVFWRLHRQRDLWNTSRYPKALRKWRRTLASE
jgi:hypothetical protein